MIGLISSTGGLMVRSVGQLAWLMLTMWPVSAFYLGYRFFQTSSRAGRRLLRGGVGKSK
jgi:hypothetical protein